MCNRLTCLLAACLVQLAPVSAERLFFPFDNGLADVGTVEDQAALIKKLGYAGICTRPQAATPELVAAFDQHGLRIMATYVVLPAGGEPGAGEEAHFKLLKEHQTVVWLSVSKLKGKASTDEEAAATIRKVVDLAAKYGLKTCLYPHVYFHTDTVKSCERVYRLVERPELGLSFTLCHFLAQNPHRELEATLKRIGPKLMLVQINGANQLKEPGPDWKQLILPLDHGDFDQGRLMRALDEIGYRGPVNLQCFNIKRPAAEHLAASMKAWKQLQTTPAK